MASDEGKDRLLLVDADADLRGLLTRRLAESGYEVHASGETTGIAAQAASEHFDLALIEVFAPERRWLELLKELRAADDDLEVVVITARDATEAGTEACRLGAFAALQRPCPFEHLLTVLQRAAERADLRRRNALLRDELRRRTGPDTIPGESAAARGLRDLVDRAARSDSPVLVEGKPGTDRERVARSIHARSARCDAPFVTFRPAAVDAGTMRSELFGHVQGAFDGATATRRGLLDRARGGTVFIDDAADLDAGSQTDLARLVEEGVLRPAGSAAPRAVDVRIIAGSARGLDRLVASGAFRRDLFTRLQLFRITVPSLCERTEDLKLLVAEVLASLPGRDTSTIAITDEALEVLKLYDWPGDERELRRMLERAALLVPEGVIGADAVRALLAARPGAGEGPTLDALERRHVVEVLRATGGNKSEAARQLGVDRRKLYRLIEKLGLDVRAG